MKEWIQNILVYVILSALLRGLISNPKYLSFFQFTSGMILLLLMTSPLLSFVSLDERWYQNLEKNLFEVDTKQIEQELSVAEDRFEVILQKEYEEKLCQQIDSLAGQQGKSVEKVSIEWEDGSEPKLTSVMVYISEVNQEESVEVMESKNVTPVKEVEISAEIDAEEGKEMKKGREDKELKKTICKEMGLNRKEVVVWSVQEG